MIEVGPGRPNAIPLNVTIKFSPKVGPFVITQNSKAYFRRSAAICVN